MTTAPRLIKAWVVDVCYACGYKLPFEDHGDPRNLTEKNLRDAT
jgi:hypothetical protein